VVVACSAQQNDIEMIVQLVKAKTGFVSNVAFLGVVMPAP
jgi:hypothetical protein